MIEDLQVRESLLDIARLLVEQSKGHQLQWSASSHRPFRYTIEFPESIVKIERAPISRIYELSVSNEVGIPLATLRVDGDDEGIDAESFDLFVQLYDLAHANAHNRKDVLDKLRARLSSTLAGNEPIGSDA